MARLRGAAVAVPLPAALPCPVAEAQPAPAGGLANAMVVLVLPGGQAMGLQPTGETEAMVALTRSACGRHRHHHHRRAAMHPRQLAAEAMEAAAVDRRQVVVQLQPAPLLKWGSTTSSWWPV